MHTLKANTAIYGGTMEDYALFFGYTFPEPVVGHFHIILFPYESIGSQPTTEGWKPGLEYKQTKLKIHYIVVGTC